MTKGAFGRILDKYAVPTGLGNVFLDCFAIAILSLTGQNPDYSQVLDDVPKLQVFLEKKRFEVGNPKHFVAQEQKRILGEFMDNAGYFLFGVYPSSFQRTSIRFPARSRLYASISRFLVSIAAFRVFRRSSVSALVCRIFAFCARMARSISDLSPSLSLGYATSAQISPPTHSEIPFPSAFS
jgi:hypothetical protein